MIHCSTHQDPVGRPERLGRRPARIVMGMAGLAAAASLLAEGYRSRARRCVLHLDATRCHIRTWTGF